MASRSQKKGSATPVPQSQTPLQQQQQERPSSPLSPTLISRLAEKTELQNLNDRLACYIDRARELESENSRLTLEINATRETVTRETSNVKALFEAELSDARKLLDETAREKAKLEIDAKRLWEENNELKIRLDKATKDLKTVEGNARRFEQLYSGISAKHQSAIADRKKALDDLKEAENERDHLRNLLDDARKNLENETLARVDLENSIQSLREELSFKDNIHSQELSEIRTRRQVDITEIDGRLSQKYEAKLQQSLQELRDQYEAQMRNNRGEIELLYEKKIKNLEIAANHNSNAAGRAAEELRETRTRIDTLNSRIADMDMENGHAKARIRELEKLLDDERSSRNDRITKLETELQRLRDEMAQQMQDYQDLMDIKISLDLEIAAYDKLLKGEENRLNITPTTHSSVNRTIRSSRASTARNTPLRGNIKRKRTTLDESDSAEYTVTASAKGDIEISDADPEGRFVKIHNKSSKEINIGGWQLLRSVGTNETQFKFHRSLKVDANSIVNVWSSDSGVTHDPPANVVMKQQKWFVGDHAKTILLNAEGQEMATNETTKQVLSTHSSRYRVNDGEDIYHQQERGSSSGRSFWLW